MKKLYMVSLGSGDFELMTLKAIDRLRDSDIICIPTKEIDTLENSRSYKIVKDALDYLKIKREFKPILNPMKLKNEDWQRQSNEILECFDIYNRVSYVTLGDASIYSTIYYLLDFIKRDNIDIYDSCEVIEGITSFSSASAKVKKPLALGDSELLIRPFQSSDNRKNTTVYMRPNRGDLLSHLDENIHIFENLNFEDEVIKRGNRESIKKYLTLIIDFFKPNIVQKILDD